MNILFDDAGRLRSGWRFVNFIVLFYFLLTLIAPFGVGRGFVAQGALLLTLATVLGWLAGGVMEELPVRAFGWAAHPGWLRDLALGSLVGALSLLAAALLIAGAGGYSFAFNFNVDASSIARTLITSMLIIILNAAAEEALFRGYPLQTLLRAQPFIIAALPSSLLFAAGHLGNPNVAQFWTFTNTTLAGVWLAVAYWKTRSLWFPLGVHWAWNWTMTAVLGIPVSGITELAPQPLLRTSEQGADWFTGGSYGVEGGAACTLMLIASSVVIWRARWVRASSEMMRYYEPQEEKQEALNDER